MVKMPYAERLKRLKRKVSGAGLEGLLVSKLVNIRYLCGFSGSAGLLLVTAAKVSLLVDGRYWEQAESEVMAVEIAPCRAGLTTCLEKLLQGCGISRLGFESEHTSYHRARDLEEKLPGQKLVPTEGLVEGLRECKDQGEVRQIRKAASLADRAFRHLLQCVKPGMREREVRAELQHFLGLAGSEGEAFPTIVASGPRSALVHGVAGGRRLKKGEPLVLDFGAVYNGYFSDLTRVLIAGRMSGRHKKVHQVLCQAQRAAIESIKAGRLARLVDSRARQVVCAAGYGEYFTHGLGHGVGLEVHESPTLSEVSTAILRAGMVVTVEPGIYMPGDFGMRLEDLVLVREDGAEVLSKAPRRLYELQ